MPDYRMWVRSAHAITEWSGGPPLIPTHARNGNRAEQNPNPHSHYVV